MQDNIFTDYGKTEPIGNFNSGSEQSFGFGETEPITPDAIPNFGNWNAPDLGNETSTQPLGPDGSFTLPDDISGIADGPGSGAYPFENSNPTEVVPPEGSYSFMPVVGWLVCIEGNDRGRDFRLHAGYNSIGKSPENDISIPSDNSISRDRHAVIAYDQEENLYFFAPANGVNLLRLNGKVLMAPATVQANDVLTVGKSKLLFVPLCTDKFQWGEEE